MDAKLSQIFLELQVSEWSFHFEKQVLVAFTRSCQATVTLVRLVEDVNFVNTWAKLTLGTNLPEQKTESFFCKIRMGLAKVALSAVRRIPDTRVDKAIRTDRTQPGWLAMRHTLLLHQTIRPLLSP